MSRADSWEELQEGDALEGLDPTGVHGAELILGHASRRSFYRLHRASGATAVLVLYPGGHGAEIDRYVRTRRWLSEAGLPVPRIESRGSRALIVEDGGDRLLAEYPTTAAARRRCYRQAVDSLLRLQRSGVERAGPNPEWALDRRRLRRELAFTEEHAFRGWLGATSGAESRGRAFDRIAEAAATVPTVLCHRDYHARNLLVRRGRLMVIDFQDVMPGPWPYDLASLLWDNYCGLPRATVAELTHRYCVARGWAGTRQPASTSPDIPPGLPGRARREFCVVGVQRSLKALGTFGYQVHVRGHRRYAEFAPRTWRHARAALVALGWDDVLATLSPLDRLPTS